MATFDQITTQKIAEFSELPEEKQKDLICLRQPLKTKFNKFSAGYTFNIRTIHPLLISQLQFFGKKYEDMFFGDVEGLMEIDTAEFKFDAKNLDHSDQSLKEKPEEEDETDPANRIKELEENNQALQREIETLTDENKKKDEAIATLKKALDSKPSPEKKSGGKKAKKNAKKEAGKTPEQSPQEEPKVGGEGEKTQEPPKTEASTQPGETDTETQTPNNDQ